MKMPVMQRRTLTLFAFMAMLLALLGYVAVRSGPLAPVAVTEIEVESQALRPALFGIGTIEARYTYKIGPTFAGRVERLDVQVGDRVHAGQLLGEMDPVDLDDRLRAQQAAVKRADAVVREAAARQTYATSQARRYELMSAAQMISEETVVTKRQELAIADAVLLAAREDLTRTQSDLDALRAQRGNLQLVAPADGIVTSRDADPGTTVVAGQAVVELIDTPSIWVNVRFDQISASGLAKDLAASIQLRSRVGEAFAGRVLRVEPKADAVTEETLAKVIFDQVPAQPPPLGELAEVTIDLPALPAMPVIPNAAIQRQGNKIGVWQIVDGAPRFVDIKLGRADLDGHVQVLEGLTPGDRIVQYSEKTLHSSSRIRVVGHIPGVPE
ncbi:efflux RND transporter periplasmic adaptor subunit [Sinimarinibacterium sp. CAU 1509]|uniref:efflux RND transporter periplasmic adaptor subunit n=1 Tax=Sinimarinibacterium sp. CAU 1509 TaxID=2562283 RepID=UPI0010AD1EA3|nr:efflux RND transporter periplasmic adaptor subunit [Sinimarinibacterium sp. CAU 1509]TJY58900.1 efflux RND transporter periplasmic adaptor subunit [Sinimarinibacterium sp. CAU 1509]